MSKGNFLRNWLPCLLFVAALSAAGLRAQEQPPRAQVATAQLRCDPLTVIKAIDGELKNVMARQGGAFTDCEIPLSAGSHLLKVCYEGGRYQVSPPRNVRYVYRCEEDKEVILDAVAGRIYRLRIGFENGFTAWIEDVTTIEGEYPASPSVNKSRRVSKEERQSMILVRSPGGEVPAFLPGAVQNHWFKASRMKQAFSGPKRMTAEPDGYFLSTISNGDTLAIRHVVEGAHYYFVCDTEVPVYEDMAGGRVLYLGDYHFERRALGAFYTVTHDLEAARRFLQAHHPQLVEKLESASLRALRVPEPCMLMNPENRLRKDPAVRLVSPGGASADSTS
jgi:hypothetical protein